MAAPGPLVLTPTRLPGTPEQVYPSGQGDKRGELAADECGAGVVVFASL